MSRLLCAVAIVLAIVSGSPAHAATACSIPTCANSSRAAASCCWSMDGLTQACHPKWLLIITKQSWQNRSQAGERIDAIFHGARNGSCAGTTGEENFNYDALNVIEQWKQTGNAPEELIFDHYKNEKMVRKRLVCQYPKVPI